MDFSDFLSTVDHYFIQGAFLKGDTWGGPICHDYVPYDIHLIESSCWVIALLIIFYYFNFIGKIKKLGDASATLLKTNEHRQSGIMRACDVFLGLLCLANWILVVYYKVNNRTLIFMLQPCHITTFLQFVALVTNNSDSVMIALLSLPMVNGSGGAFLFPDTNGLNQFKEVEMFWVQHILLQALPFYLLLRYNGLSLKLIDFKTVAIGIWFIIFAHWSLFELLNYNFLMNVNFFLCPTAGMLDVLPLVPPLLLKPSYRSILMVFYFVTSVLLTYLYVLMAKVVLSISNAISPSKSKMN